MTAGRATFGIAQASRRWWAVLVLLVAVSLFAYRTRDRQPRDAARFGGPAQGTTYSVVLGGPRGDATIRTLQAAVDSLLDDVDARMSTWIPTSELSRLNAMATTAPVPVSAPLADVLRQALEVSRASGGAFDVTIGPFVEAWGFGASARTPTVPDDRTLDSLRARVGWRRLAVTDSTVTKGHPRLMIDLAGIAPGWTVDRISALLTARGEPDHLVDVGGEVRAQGRNAEGRPFRVGIEEPDPEGRRVRLVVGLSDRALATSGNYRDVRVLDGVRYVHTIDPVAGRPVTHRLLSVSVLHASCAHADAWATALLVVGPERAWELAAANGLDVLLLTGGPDGEVQERMTAGFAATVLRDGR
jgi:thiamine biosynthesis lipoprotein